MSATASLTIKKHIHLCNAPKSWFWSKMASGSGFHSSYKYRNDLGIGKATVCCGGAHSWACSDYLARIIFLQDKIPSLLPFLLLEHLCCCGRDPKEKPPGRCSRQSDPAGLGEEMVQMQLNVVEPLIWVVVFFFKFQKDSFSKDFFICF